MLHVWNIYIYLPIHEWLKFMGFLEGKYSSPIRSIWICYFVPGKQPSILFLKKGYFPMFPIGSMYGLFTYMKGEKWPHSRGNGLVNIPIPWSIWVFFQGIGGV